jgi:prepilin-type N-terminal cleavage/methylation domain-containing protein
MMNGSCRLSARRGVTLVEMLVGVAIVGVVLALALPPYYSFIERRRIVAAASEVADMFTFARSESNAVTETLNLHMEPVPPSVGKFSCMRLSVAAVTDFCRCNLPQEQVCRLTGRLLREFVLPSDTWVTFSATGTWGFQPYRLAFSHGGFPDIPDVKVTVTGTRTGAQLRVEYSSTGRVRTCSPEGSMSGYPVCQ